MWSQGVRDQRKGTDEGTMREKDRKLARKRLDVEMKPYRQAGKDKNPTSELLRAVRQVLRIPVAEIAQKMGVNRSAVHDLEAREESGAIMMRSMERMAEAMGCKLVYGIIPEGGKTLEELAEKRLWKAVFERQRTEGQGLGTRD
jgi:predicted DNA-binding mobile mystery protein A